MNADLEFDLREAFDARADTTTTSPDAWARVNRRVERRAHRRAASLTAAAAALVVVLAVGGGLALLRDRDHGSTVATGDTAAKSAAEDSAAASPERSGGVTTTPLLPDAPGLLVRQLPDGSISVRRGEAETPPVRPGQLAAAVGADGVVFGIAPAGAGSVQVSADTAGGVTKTAVADLAASSGTPRTFVVSGFGDALGPIRVDAGGTTTIATDGASR